MYVNHSPPEYHVWKVLNSLVNVKEIRYDLNTNISIYSIECLQTNLNRISIRTISKIKLNKMSFYNLYNLKLFDVDGSKGYQYELPF